MTGVDPRLVAALESQLEFWRAALASGAQRVGWKLGMGEGERIGAGPVVGHLTTATQLEPCGAYRLEGAVDLRADAEVAVLLGADVDPETGLAAAAAAIAGYGAALELLDLGAPPPGDPERIVATNIWHRAFALDPLDRPAPPDGAQGRLLIDGEVCAGGPLAKDCPGLVQATANLLGAVGERLQAGDCLITGSIVQVPIGRGDEVTAELGPLGQAHLSIH